MFSHFRGTTRVKLAIFAVAASLLAAGTAIAQTGNQPSAGPTKLPDPKKTVVARILGEDILLVEILRMAERLPDQYKKLPLPAVYPSLLQRAIDARLVASAGRAAGYAENDQVKRRMRDAESQIISEIFLTESVSKRITEDSLREQYEGRKDKLGGGDQVKARHILMETEEEAKAVIEALNKGDDFAKLASEKSTGPSASSGGDLGWFGQGQMVPEFSEAAFGMTPGNFTTEPVKTQFGWHVILVEDRKIAEAPSFEQVRDQLSSEMSGVILQEMLVILRGKTKVERFNFDGGPMPEGPVPTPKN